MLAYIYPVGGGADGRPDNSLPGSPGHPGNALPWHPGRPDNSLPTLPGHPSHPLPPFPGYPSNGLPAGGVIDNGLPLPPMPPTINPPPPVIWPGVPIHPETPDNSLPGAPPGTIYPPLPPSITGKALVLVYVYGVGHRWVVVETAQPKTK